MYPAVLLTYFISVAVILLASLASLVQVSLPYNKTGRVSVLYNFIVVFFRVFLQVQKLRVAILPLDLPCSGPVTHSGEILTTGKSRSRTDFL